MTHDRATVLAAAAALGPRGLVDLLGLGDGARTAPTHVSISCPWHADASPSCSVRTAPDGTLAAHCFACGAGGSALDLLAAVRGLDARTDCARLLDELAHLVGAGAALDAPPPVRRPPSSPPPRDEVRALWDACRRDSRRLRAYAAHRGWDADRLLAADLARIAPPARSWDGWPAWWPRGRAWGWPLVVPMWSGEELVALHGVSLAFGAARARAQAEAAAQGREWLKTISPRGVALVGHFGRVGARARAVLVCEGASDYLAAALDALEVPALAVVGAVSGLFGALGRELAAMGLPVIVATDPDDAGDRYAYEVERKVRTVRLRCACDLADLRRTRGPGAIVRAAREVLRAARRAA